MSRKRTPLHQSITSLAASLPDIPSGDETLAQVGFSVVEKNVMSPKVDVLEPSKPTPSPTDLFSKWLRTPDGSRVTDGRIPTDPVRLGCIMDDNARIAFMAGYAAATPSFE
jgi:hypothetical protein